MPKQKEAAPLPKTGVMRKIVDHLDKPDFWKPTKFGEVMFGKLLAITEGQKGPVLQLQLFNDEVHQFGVPTQLRKVAWSDLVGHNVKLTYAASVPTNKGNPAKLFDVEAD